MVEISGEDWKQRARAEREATSKKIEGEGEGAGPHAGPFGGAEADEAGPPPEASLTVLVLMLAAEARMHLRLLPEGFPGAGAPQGPPDLEKAKFVIDLVGVLDEKTKGNRGEEEDEFLRAVLDDLRLAFVGRSKERG
jgi:hypothetical protein